MKSSYLLFYFRPHFSFLHPEHFPPLRLKVINKCYVLMTITCIYFIVTQISGSGKNYVTMCVYKTACVCACVCVTISVILTHVVITDLTHHTPTLCVKQHVAPIRHPVAPLDGNSGAGTRTVHKIDQTKTKCNIPKTWGWNQRKPGRRVTFLYADARCSAFIFFFL